MLIKSLSYVWKKKVNIKKLKKFTLYHPKLFECTFCTLNYDPYYTLYPDIKFAVNLDGNSKFKEQSVIRSIV